MLKVGEWEVSEFGLSRYKDRLITYIMDGVCVVVKDGELFYFEIEDNKIIVPASCADLFKELDDEEDVMANV